MSEPNLGKYHKFNGLYDSLFKSSHECHSLKISIKNSDLSIVIQFSSLEAFKFSYQGPYSSFHNTCICRSNIMKTMKTSVFTKTLEIIFKTPSLMICFFFTWKSNYISCSRKKIFLHYIYSTQTSIL